MDPSLLTVRFGTAWQNFITYLNTEKSALMYRHEESPYLCAVNKFSANAALVS